MEHDTFLRRPGPVIAVHDTGNAARATVYALYLGSFDTHKLSVVGKALQFEERAMGFYAAGDRVCTWGRIGGFWRAIWGQLSGPAVLVIPELGLVASGGPFAMARVAAPEAAVSGAGMSALAGALVGVGHVR